jgi:hypothetical protein
VKTVNYMSAHNRRLVQFVHTHQPCTLARLREEPSIHKESADLNRLSNRLSFIKQQGWLLYERGVWITNPDQPHDQPKPSAHRAKQAKAECREPVEYVGVVVPPAQNDLMHSPVYRPKPHPVARAGATQFLSCPSRGHAC